MNSVATTVLLISLIAHSFLLAYVQVRAGRLRTGWAWASLTILFSLLAAAVLFLPDEWRLADRLGRHFLSALALAALMVAFSALVVQDVTLKDDVSRLPRLWLLLGIVWIVGLVVLTFAADSVTVGAPEWLLGALTTPDALSLLMLGGLGIFGALLLGRVFYAFYTASLPEIANRALFWVLDIALILIGVVLTISGTMTLVPLGSMVLLLGCAGAVYALLSYRVFDIRTEFSSALRLLVVLALTTAFILGAILLAYSFGLAATGEGLLSLGLVALAAALVYLPARSLVETIIHVLLSRSMTDAAEVIRQYSQQISSAVELDALVEIITRALNRVMRVRRSGAVLVSDGGVESSEVELQLFPPVGDGRLSRGRLSKTSPIYRHLAIDQRPLSQFELEYDRRFKDVSEDEEQFFRDSQMSAYAPIVAENTLIGILACGAKLNDAPYSPHDLELLATMANQTGTALRNARLVADLRRLNESMKLLNSTLEGAKDQMEKLDSVKTDFITIASHELRTPLAQIRGYTDILDALNESSMLDRDQTSGMVANLRKATERMEELIGAMLDVSQLDVNSMDLRFAQTSLESVMRMAIEPLTDAIKQRKLTLSARGLRGLPIIQADLQRLVQAFRNVVVNAIKFTPDGGRIDINATVKPAQYPGEKDHIQITISDTGVGIDRDNLELIFRKFYRTSDPGLHSTGTYKFLGAGPGLGLTIAKGVIEGHGGKIWAESAGHNLETCPGSTFTILLPVTPPEDARRVLPFQAEPSEPVSTEPTLLRTQLPG